MAFLFSFSLLSYYIQTSFFTFFFLLVLVKELFILLHELQIPAKPNYSLVLYYAADRPVNKESLLGRFVDGTDVFRDARFKLIPSIIEVHFLARILIISLLVTATMFSD